MSIFIIIAIVLLFAIMIGTRSCFYAINQPFLRQTGELVDKEKSTGYYYGYGIFKGNIYYWSNTMIGSTPEKLKNVDKETFIVLSNSYAKDKNRAYFGAEGDANVDVLTFEYVGPDKNYGFARDKNHVYTLYAPYSDRAENSVFKIIPDADPATYQQLEQGWSKDDKNVYFLNKKTDADPDPQTFVVISNYYSKDKYYLYTQERGIAYSITKTKCNTDELVLVGDRYIRTNTNLYYFSYDADNKLSNIPIKDTASIEMLGLSGWLKADGKIVLNGVWLNDPQVDEKTFVSLGWQYFKDKNNVYFWKWNTRSLTVMAEADLNTFEQIDGGYAKDKNHVYYQNEILPDANPKDFRYDKKSGRGYSGNDVYVVGKKRATKK